MEDQDATLNGAADATRTADPGVRYLEAAMDVAVHLQRTADVAGAVAEFLPALCRHLDWDVAGLWLLEADVLRCVETWRVPDERLAVFEQATSGLVVRPGEGIAGRCWKHGEAIVIKDVAAELPWPRHEVAVEAGLHTAVAFPLVGPAGIFGAVDLLSTGHLEVTQELRTLLTTVGRQLGQVLDAVRLDAERRYRSALLDAQFEASEDGILAVSPDHRVLASNGRFEELWHLPPGSVQPGDDATPTIEAARSLIADSSGFDAALLRGDAHRLETQRVVTRLSDGRVLSGYGAPIVDETGTYHGRVWFLRDDTIRRRAEAEREQLVQRLTTAQRRQAFLLQASTVVAGAEGYEDTLQRLAAVAVPTLADICLIDIVTADGSIERLAARHADPAKQPLVDELRHRYPPVSGGPHPTSTVIGSRTSRWSAEMSDEFLWAISHDEHHYKLTKELEFTSYITVPLVAGSDVFGAVNLISAGSGRHFGTADVTMAEDLAAQVVQVVAKVRRYEAEHRLAHTLQASLLPARLPAVPGLSIAVRYLASTQGADVGGDWYDVLAFPDGAADLTVGDVAGHDIGAAAAMGQMRSAARAMAGRSTGPGSLIERLHNSWTNMGIDRMATMVVARLEPSSGHLVVASAGHPPPMVLSDGRARFLPITPGAPLGAPAVPADEWSEVLAPGDILLLYTDGLVEARRTGVDEGMEKLAAAAEAAEPTPDEVADTVLAALGADREDDVALLAVARA